jgi:hypothetical protein
MDPACVMHLCVWGWEMELGAALGLYVGLGSMLYMRWVGGACGQMMLSTHHLLSVNARVFRSCSYCAAAAAAVFCPANSHLHVLLACAAGV